MRSGHDSTGEDVMRATTARRLGLLTGAVMALSPVLAACTEPGSRTAPSDRTEALDRASSATASPAPRVAAPTTAAAGGAPAATPTPGSDVAAGGAGPAEGADLPRSAEPPEAPSSTVDVVVTFAVWEPGAAQVQVGAYVADVLEVDGRCTLRLTSEGRTAAAESAAVADAAVTGCGALAVDGSELSTGRWTATVEYTSPTSTGRSAPVDIEVP